MRAEQHDQRRSADGEVDAPGARRSSRVARDVVLGRVAERHQRADARARATASSSNGSKRQRAGARSARSLDAAAGSALWAACSSACREAPRTQLLLTPNQSSRIRRAAGAAASAPKPPCSTVDGDDDRPRLVGHVGDVPGLVGLPRALGGAGLAVDRVASCGQPAKTSADVPPRLARRSAQAVEDRLAVAPGRSSTRARRRRARCCWSSRPPASSTRRPRCGRAHLAAVGDRRVGDRHLQRRGLQVALADREVDVVAQRPGRVSEMPQACPRAGARRPPRASRPARARRGRGSSAAELAGQVDAGRAGRGRGARAHVWSALAPSALSSAPSV